MKKPHTRLCCACVCIVLASISFFPQVGFAVQPTTLNDQIDLRIPGMTESFTMVLCPETTIETEEGFIEVPALYVLNTEVTWDLYDIYVYKLDEPEEGSLADAISRPSKPYVPPDRGFGHEGYPAIGMTFQAAEGFCEWLSTKSGLDIRLPTKTEWTYLATSGEDTEFCCDTNQESLDQVGWFSENSDHSTHPVGLLTPNSFGLFDMHGNSAEWVTSGSRKPIAFGGGYRDSASDCTGTSFQKQVSSWNQSDPQIPKSQWWLADCSWVGFRFVIEADDINQNILEGLTNVSNETD